MVNNYDYTVRLQAHDTGSAVLVKSGDTFYLLTAAHVSSNTKEGDKVVITNVDGTNSNFPIQEQIISSHEDGFDICIMKIPADVASSLTSSAKCATFEGSGYPCEIEGFPSNSSDERIRIETNCHIAKETETGDALYVKLEEQRCDGQKMQDVENGFSGSGVFVDSNGEKYLVGIVYSVEETRSLFIGWKMQKINEVLKGEGWIEIPLIPIELRQQIIKQYNKLVTNSDFVLSRIKDSIIGKVRLPRVIYIERILEALDKSRVVIITGEAGIGKSALAKTVLSAPAFKSIAIVGDNLDQENESRILSKLEIEDRLQKIYKSPICGNGRKVLLVESAERMMNTNSETAIVFIENLLREVEDLKVVFTVRKHSFNHLMVILQGNGISVPGNAVIDVGLLDDEELNSVGDAVTTLTPYLSSDKTKQILRIPFYLNLACSMTSTLNNVNLKESEFKNMLCRQIVSGKGLDMQIASKRIDSLIEAARKTSNAGMNLIQCEMSDAVQSLVKDDILAGDTTAGMLRPSHDILTDWGLTCHIDHLYHQYNTHEITIDDFYNGIDRNITSRNMFRQYIDSKISEDNAELNDFISKSLSLKLEDYVYDDLFYAILISSKGVEFLSQAKQSLLDNDCALLKRLANALSYMFRKVDWNAKQLFEKSGLIEEGEKVRNSYYILPTGKGWYTFVSFLYENRDVFYALRGQLIPLLLQCELVNISEEEASKLRTFVFSILADDMDTLLSNKGDLEGPDENVIRLLFKWIDEAPERIKGWAEKTLTSDSYKYDGIKKFLLLSEGLESANFINRYPDIYKALIRKEWIDDKGIVRDYYPMIYQASGLTTTYKCFFYAQPSQALMFLCEILNYDIEQQKSDRQLQIEEIKVMVEDKERTIWGNDALWREYRGRNYISHIRESLLMSFETWLMDCINNNINKARYAMSTESLFAVFDFIYNNCVSVCAWAVLASVATRFRTFVGMKAMPIYSCWKFILWDKTRLGLEMTPPMINPLASHTIKKEALKSSNLEHRKQDLEYAILNLSITDGFIEEFRNLVKYLKKSASTFNEKVSAGRMDVSQYKIIGKTEEGVLIQGQPSDDIIEDVKHNEVISNKFFSVITSTNSARKFYDDDATQDLKEWKEAYNVQKDLNDIIATKGLIAAWGVKKFWERLDEDEKVWCDENLIEGARLYASTGMYQSDTEHCADGLLFLLDKKPNEYRILQSVKYLIGAIVENDTAFIRFENTFKRLIWQNHKEIANILILDYIQDDYDKKSDIQKFAQVCKLIPVDIEDAEWNKLIIEYCQQYFSRWADNTLRRYERIGDMRLEIFCAEYMIAMPNKRKTFIEDIWLSSILKIAKRRYDENDNPISKVFNHYCHIATQENMENFWQLWEIMFEWYKKHNSKDVLSSLMLNFDVLRPKLLNDWGVMKDAAPHINKLLSLLPTDGVPYLPKLICRIGFSYLMPECLHYIDISILKASARVSLTIKIWQDAVEDMYDNAQIRDLIKRDNTLRVAYIEILNGLISNGSAIAYIIRDYYI